MCTLVTAVIKVDGVRSIQVGVLGDVRRLRVQQDALVIIRVEAEGVAMLTKTVDVGIIRQLGTQANILLLEDQRNGSGIEENLAVVPTLDSERKRGLLDIELESGRRRGRLLVLGAGESLLLNLEDLKVGVVDLDM
jgi:hypothetical protein